MTTEAKYIGENETFGLETGKFYKIYMRLYNSTTKGTTLNVHAVDHNFGKSYKNFEELLEDWGQMQDRPDLGYEKGYEEGYEEGYTFGYEDGYGPM